MQPLAAPSRLCGLLAIVIAALVHAQTVTAPFAAMSDPLSRASSAERPHPAPPADRDLRRLAAAADRLQPQRPGTVDAYVVAVALDSDPVFGREAREAARVLARRYDAAGRTLVLAGPDGRGIDPLPRGTPDTLHAAITRVAALMQPGEDALILYVTAHGNPAGIVWREQGQVLGTLPPKWLRDGLAQSGIRNRLLILSACFSGIFVPALASRDGAVVTAAAADRTSFGCVADNDWTFFGDALVNHALRKPQPLKAAVAEARMTVGGWEAEGKLVPSNPQVAIGPGTAAWLGALEARMPRAASAPVGQPATGALDAAARH